MKVRAIGSAVAVAAMLTTFNGPPGAVTGAEAGTGSVFTGELAQVDGEPLPERTVRLFAAPPVEAVTKMKVGAQRRSVDLGRTTTDDQGQFRLAVTERVAASLKRGRFDATFVVVDGKGVVSGLVTTMETTKNGVRIVPGLVKVRDQHTAKVPGGALRSTATLDESDEAATDFGVTASRTSGTVTAAKAGGTPLVSLTAPNGSVDRPADTRMLAKASDDYQCTDGHSMKLLKKHKNRLTAVNSIHANTDGHETQFILSRGADARLGAASKWGKTWTVSGGTSRSLNSETWWGKRTKAVNRVLQTRYTMGHYEEKLSERGSCVRWYSKRGVAHEGGAESNKANAMKVVQKYCRNYEKNGRLVLSRGRATNWSNGLSMAKFIGFDLEASAGYSSGEKIDVWITKPKRKICGANKLPADHPARVVVAKR